MSGAVAVLGRIEDIQTTIQQISPAARAATATSSATDFDAALAELTSTIDPTLLGRLSGTSAPATAVPTTSAPTAPTTAPGVAPTDAASTAVRATGADLVAEARKYLGVPYVWGGESANGLDCSGLVQLTLGSLGVGMPRVARDQMNEGTPVASMADARVGDLLVFDGGSHIAIYLGEGRMIDAPKPGRVVSERDVYETPTAIRRVLPGADDALLASSAAQRSSLSQLIGGTA